MPTGDKAEAVDFWADIKAITDSVAEWITTINAGNVEGKSIHAADDTAAIPPDEPAFIGRNAVRSSRKKLDDLFAFEEKYIVENAIVGGKLAAVEHGC